MINPLRKKPLILIADDESSNLQLMRQILQGHYDLVFAKDGQRCIEIAERELPNIILLDVMMPGMTGYEACRRLKESPQTQTIPVIFVTALVDAEDEFKGFECGAVDYITKPVSPSIVMARVRTHLSLVRMEDLITTRLEIIHRLGRAAEYKDNETGAHVIRMSQYARILGVAAGLSAAQADDLLHAAPMHDIGKIGIADAILQKPGPLDGEERRIMQNHTLIGADIIGEHSSGLLAMAREIALTHHEKWDGSGYPTGLCGDAIPLEGRIVAVADVFDALTTIRPYKKAWPLEEGLRYLKDQRSRHFDPHLVDLFLEQAPAIKAIKDQWTENELRSDPGLSAIAA